MREPYTLHHYEEPILCSNECEEMIEIIRTLYEMQGGCLGTKTNLLVSKEYLNITYLLNEHISKVATQHTNEVFVSLDVYGELAEDEFVLVAWVIRSW